MENIEEWSGLQSTSRDMSRFCEGHFKSERALIIIAQINYQSPLRDMACNKGENKQVFKIFRKSRPVEVAQMKIKQQPACLHYKPTWPIQAFEKKPAS